ncbi:protein PIN-LIKES 7 [Lolium perenne]|uniref:protein PIN-LIKES 7 n=1 Tax=Lolium perenne TaxID=4522 RepID=UPI0021F5D563|nr:protein PIN-LIKES 5-like [Lolium perenne]XP_051183481.1 protein PIN-LIKES 5-like [Lolium perenne]XP_051183482.1 protein PIN-LIKES 5-like [Lolium perenne]
MRFWSLLVVAWMPVLQVLLAGMLGACLASSRFNVLTSDARRSINKIVYIVFVPSLVFSSLAGTVTLKDVISWWFMPVNMSIIFLIGATLGWLAVKTLRPGEHLQGLVIACSSAGNWGTIPLMIVPAICNEEDSPFGDATTCKSLGISYVSLSMALGNFFIWTHSYSVMKRSAQLYNKGCNDHPTTNNVRKEQNSGEDQNGNYVAFLPMFSSADSCEDVPNNSVSPTLPSNSLSGTLMHYFRRAKDLLVEILKELWSPPSVAALVGFTVGAIDKLKSLVTEEDSPLRVVQDTAQLLGDAAIPCTVLILGGNLTKGRGRTTMKPLVVISIIVIRFVILPACGIGVVKAARELGFLPGSPLYHYVLLLQSTVPPAMSIGTIAQLFDVGEEECSIVFLWTHLVAALALTLWSTVFMSLVS